MSSKTNSFLNYYFCSYRSIESSVNELWKDPKPSAPIDFKRPSSGTSSSSSRSDISHDGEDFDYERQACKRLAEEWGIHRFENRLWSNPEKPSVSIRKYTDLVLNETERKGVLTDRIIASCSSYLARSPQVQHYAYCKCVLRNKMLCNVEILAYHHYLQYLDLSWNELVDIEVLGQLPFLMYLDVSHNFLENILDFKAPSNLTFVNFSYNFVKEFRDISDFWSIIHLDLSFNLITSIPSTIQNLKYLHYLNLAGNLITCLKNLNTLPIKKLFIQFNKIFTANIYPEHKNSKTFDYITSVNISNNQLTSLLVFKSMKNLESLDASTNNISSLLELMYLSHIKFLLHLNLKNNHICKLNNYTFACLTNCTSLISLDGEEITVEKRVETSNKTEYNPKFAAMRDKLNLIMLHQLSEPHFDFGLTLGAPSALMMVLVGVPGSNKGKLVRAFCKKQSRFAVVGISHTNRPKTENEVDGVDYYFVTHDAFQRMLKEGAFLTHSDFNDYSYGFAYTELQKTARKVLVTHMDIDAALVLRMRGLNPKLVLAVPSTTEKHFEQLQAKYMFHLTADGIKVNKCEVDHKKRASPEINVGLKGKYRRLSELDSDDGLAKYTMELSGNRCCRMKNKDCEQDVNLSAMKLRLLSEEKQKFNSIMKQREQGCHKFSQFSVSFKLCDIEYKCGTRDCNHDRKIMCKIPTQGREMSSFISLLTDIYVDETSSEIYLKIPQSASQEAMDHSQNILSVLSNFNLSGGYGYATTGGEAHDRTIEALAHFLQAMFDMRHNLLDLHWNNGGLFVQVVFTDEEDKTFLDLTEVLKDTIEYYKFTNKNMPLTKDLIRNKTVKDRVENLQIEIKGNDPSLGGINCTCKLNASTESFISKSCKVPQKH